MNPFYVFDTILIGTFFNCNLQHSCVELYREDFFLLLLVDNWVSSLKSLVYLWVCTNAFHRDKQMKIAKNIKSQRTVSERERAKRSISNKKVMIFVSKEKWGRKLKEKKKTTGAKRRWALLCIIYWVEQKLSAHTLRRKEKRNCAWGSTKMGKCF